MADTIETTGTEASGTNSAPETPGAAPETVPAPAATETKGTEGRPDPDEDVMAATLAMAKAAAEGREEAMKAADGIARETLIKTIAFQLPLDWIDADTNARIQKIETESLALILSWLALNWWAGYAIGQQDTIAALKIAAAKGLASPEDKVAIDAVEQGIKKEREREAVTAGETPAEGSS